ncbi:Aldehyde Dehydrogenase [Intrasporangium calvum DSM 43043]|uniref:Aldehyde dehydrogenase n=2 Tax=Intrasporangium calvum TaxID=53358 RepID=E6SDK4_INTC7|nr:aldehyde dehydrogenase family protein [Intrasporangium calvum]ADU48656.1 Aldehyde Dehydrogenase [Intrasporangium calvum DSM 43043]
MTQTMRPTTDGAEGATTLEAASLVDELRSVFAAGVTKPLAWRTAQLTGLRRMLTEQETALADALATDLGKHGTESWITELGFTSNEITHILRNLKSWLRPRATSIPLWMRPARAKVVREPLGVVLVISPWNYPVQLSLAPLAGALAAGNAVVLKPSELAPATSAVLARLLPQYLDASAVRVVEGGVPETTELLAERWDHIFFTGNGAVGRVVLEAAARHLTPVTLELGGKSPAFVDEGADLETAARRIVWGKFTNAGQTCVAPDFVIATRPVLDALRPLIDRAIRDFYGEDASRSEGYGRIVNARHFGRLAALITEGHVVRGGAVDADNRYIEPTVLDGVDGDHLSMQEEIFGPILPLVEVGGVDEAVQFVTARDKPLALYVFTSNGETKRRFIRDTSSGGLIFNAPLVHMGAPRLPFGGVGESGMGKYHGEESVAIFSHAKAVVDVPAKPDLLAAIYPPFSSVQDRLVRRFIARPRP